MCSFCVIATFFLSFSFLFYFKHHEMKRKCFQILQSPSSHRSPLCSLFIDGLTPFPLHRCFIGSFFFGSWLLYENSNMAEAHKTHAQRNISDVGFCLQIMSSSHVIVHYSRETAHTDDIDMFVPFSYIFAQLAVKDT